MVGYDLRNSNLKIMQNDGGFAMRKLLLLVALLFAGIALTACGGGSSSGTDAGTPGTPGSTEFTAQMLDTGPTYYVTYPDGAGNTTQEVFTFSGTGPYTVNFTIQEFDGSGTLIGTPTTATVPVTLNVDGTLTAGALGDPERTTLTLISTTATYLEVTGVDSQGSFTDYWNLSQPTGWLPVGGDGAIGFTAAMLDAGPAYYVTYIDAGNTIQEVYAFSGAGPYTVNITNQEFDGSNNLIGTPTTFTVPATLNTDGTLTAGALGDPDRTTMTLISTTATYLEVTGVDSQGSFTHNWNLSQPAGWLPVGGGGAIDFTAAMLDAGPTYYVTYPDGLGNTTQEVFTFSGTGPYTVNFTIQEFDGSGTLIGTATATVPVTLNADGTLTAGALGDPERTTLTLISTTATYLEVTGVDSQGSFTDTWNLSQPAGWL